MESATEECTGMDHKCKQTCFRCGSSIRRLYFEVVNCHRYCSECMSKPNYRVKDAIDREVPIWSQVHSMSSRDIRYDKGNLKVNVFSKLE